MSKIQTNKIQHTANGAAEFTLPTADGTNGQVLTTNGSGTLSFGTDQKGKVLQVVSVSDSVRETVGAVTLSSANTYYDTPFAVTITPSATSSKILLMGDVMGEFNFDDYDPCPLNDNPNKDGLKEDWANTTFVNPPYSKLKTTKNNAEFFNSMNKPS